MYRACCSLQQRRRDLLWKNKGGKKNKLEAQTSGGVLAGFGRVKIHHRGKLFQIRSLLTSLAFVLSDRRPSATYPDAYRKLELENIYRNTLADSGSHLSAFHCGVFLASIYKRASVSLLGNKMRRAGIRR